MIQLTCKEDLTFTQEQLLEFLQNRDSLLKENIGRDFEWFLKRLVLVDDVVIKANNHYGCNYQNPSTGRKADVDEDWGYDEDGKKLPKKYHVTFEAFRNIRVPVESGISLPKAKKIALDWVVRGIAPEHVYQDYDLVFRQTAN